MFECTNSQKLTRRLTVSSVISVVIIFIGFMVLLVLGTAQQNAAFYLVNFSWCEVFIAGMLSCPLFLFVKIGRKFPFIVKVSASKDNFTEMNSGNSSSSYKHSHSLADFREETL